METLTRVMRMACWFLGIILMLIIFFDVFAPRKTKSKVRREIVEWIRK